MKRQALIALAAMLALAGCGGSPAEPELSAPNAARMNGGGLGSGHVASSDATNGTQITTPPDSTGRIGGMGSGH
jgi:ABC-type glycerol-3-phosphate transport system substrate-binding protein